MTWVAVKPAEVLEAKEEGWPYRHLSPELRLSLQGERGAVAWKR